MLRFMLALMAVVLTLVPARLNARTPQQVATQPNAIQAENALPGTASWMITRPEWAHQIEGYASTTSAAPGETISFSVSTTSAWFVTDIYRTGWYNGLGARLVFSLPGTAGHDYPIPTPNPQTGEIACDWPTTFTLSIPSDWATGMYMAKLTAADGYQAYIPFIVRSRAPGGDLLFIHAVNTDEAYNAWGGKSLYGDVSYAGDHEEYSAHRAVKVSFARPFAQGVGSGQFFYWEFSMVRFLEQEGYDVTYVSDLDVHEHPQLLTHYRGIIVAGHSEYWSKDMRDGLEAAAGQGVNVAVFGGNSLYNQVRFEPGADGPDRVEVFYKSTDDPLYSVDNSQVTRAWRMDPPGRPEERFLGSQFAGWNGDAPFPWVVANASSWVFDGTGLRNGDSIPGVVGYEWDSVQAVPGSPPNVTVLAHSPVTDYQTQAEFADSTAYSAASGARIVNMGTIEWPLSLDHPDLPTFLQAPYHGYTDTRSVASIQRITNNVLLNFITQPSVPLPTDTPLPTNTPTPLPTFTPTPTPTMKPRPTASPTPTREVLSAAAFLAYPTVAPRGSQRIQILTVPRAHIVINVYFPDGAHRHHGGHADGSGRYRWSFKQPVRAITVRNHTVNVSVTVDLGTGTHITISRTYFIR